MIPVCFSFFVLLHQKCIYVAFLSKSSRCYSQNQYKYSLIVVTRIILFFASLRENLFVFLFPLFCYYLSLLALRNTPVDYVTTPFYLFIYLLCVYFFFGSSFTKCSFWAYVC